MRRPEESPQSLDVSEDDESQYQSRLNRHGFNGNRVSKGDGRTARSHVVAQRNGQTDSRSTMRLYEAGPDEDDQHGSLLPARKAHSEGV